MRITCLGGPSLITNLVDMRGFARMRFSFAPNERRNRDAIVLLADGDTEAARA